jgi:hypothetical protein
MGVYKFENTDVSKMQERATELLSQNELISLSVSYLVKHSYKHLEGKDLKNGNLQSENTLREWKTKNKKYDYYIKRVILNDVIVNARKDFENMNQRECLGYSEFDIECIVTEISVNAKIFIDILNNSDKV